MPATAERSEGKGGNVLKTMAVVPRCSAPLSCAPPYAGKPPLCSRWGSALTFCRTGGFVPPSEHFPVPSSGKMLTHALTGLAIKVPPSAHPPAPPAPKLGAKRGPGVGHNFSISMPSFAARHLQAPHEEAGSFPLLSPHCHTQEAMCRMNPIPPSWPKEIPWDLMSKSLKEGGWGGGSRACPCPGTQLGLPQEGQSQRQGRALRDISPNVSFWCQSTGTASVAVQAVEPR